RAVSYEFRTSQPLFGSVTHGFGVSALINDSLGRRRAFYGMGYELQALRRRGAFGPYALLALELGLSTDTARQELGAQWSAGGGRDRQRVRVGGYGGERVRLLRTDSVRLRPARRPCPPHEPRPGDGGHGRDPGGGGPAAGRHPTVLSAAGRRRHPRGDVRRGE